MSEYQLLIRPGVYGSVMCIRQDIPVAAVLNPRQQRLTDAPQARAPNAPQTRGYGYAQSDDGIAAFQIHGMITDLANSGWEDNETIAELLIRDIVNAKDDPQCRGGMFLINSPGGYVDANYALADAVAAFAAAKPSASWITSVGASGAYLQAATSGHITAYKSALVGSIGTRTVLFDLHRLAERIGIEVIPIDSGGMKSAGLPGTEITAEQREYFRARVMKLNQFFVEGVARGRRTDMQRAQQWADGRIHIAADAKALGLIDDIGTADQAMAGLRQRVNSRSGSRAAAFESPSQNDAGIPTIGTTHAPSDALATVNYNIELPTQSIPAGGCSAGEVNPTAQAPADAGGSEAEHPKDSDMTQNTTAPASSEPQVKPAASTTSTSSGQVLAASMAELKSACPGAPSDFLVEQSENGVTVAQAKDAFLHFQSAQISARDTELAKLQQASKTQGEPPARKPGAKVVESGKTGTGESTRQAGTYDGGDPVSTFNARVCEKMQQLAPQGTEQLAKARRQAITAVVREDRELHQAYLEATNPGRRQRELIADRFSIEA